MTDNQPSVLPPLYAAWVDELLQGPIPPETEATCHDCAMCAKGTEVAAPNGDGYFFNPQTKCCTYLPELHNFLVGRMLSDEDPASATGRATVEARLQAGIAVTPLGLGRSPVHALLYANSVNAFGRAQSFRCPHYLEEEGGRCGVWRHRESVCATWFCQHVRGAVGMNFWKALLTLLSTIETSLARWCVTELDVGSEALARLFPSFGQAGRNDQIDADLLDGVADPQRQRMMWGKWSGREAEFYQECARRVNPLTWHEVTAICGPEAQAYARLTCEAYQKLISEEVPARLQVGPFRTIQLSPNCCRVSAGRAFVQLDLSQTLMGVLPYFDGRPTDEVLQAMAQREGVKLNQALIRRLVDFGILVPCENPAHERQTSVCSLKPTTHP